MNHRIKILIVEDNVLVREALDFTFKKHFNCKTFMASGVDAGLAIMLDEEPDVIILDYDLQEATSEMKNGLAFLEAMKELSVQIPTVIVSGQPNKTMAVELIKNGAVDYVFKEDDDFLDQTVEALKNILQVKFLKQSLKENKDYIRKRVNQVTVLCVVLVGVFIATSFIWN